MKMLIKVSTAFVLVAVLLAALSSCSLFAIPEDFGTQIENMLQDPLAGKNEDAVVNIEGDEDDGTVAREEEGGIGDIFGGLFGGDKQGDTATGKTPEPATEYSASDFYDIIDRWDTYDYLGCCCLYSTAPDWIFDYLTDEQKDIAANVYRIDCCSTVEQARKHVYDYIDSSVVSQNPRFDESMYLEQDGCLYTVIGAVGKTSHDKSSIVATDNGDGTITMTATMLNSGDVPCGTSTFKLDEIGGDYVIVGYSFQ